MLTTVALLALAVSLPEAEWRGFDVAVHERAHRKAKGNQEGPVGCGIRIRVLGVCFDHPERKVRRDQPEQII